MRILIVGSDKVFSIENFYVRYLQMVGVETFNFTAQSTFYDYYQGSIFNKIVFKLGLSRIYARINRQFRKAVIEFRPEIIWVFKGMEIFPSSLEWARLNNIRLVNYNPDNPFLFSGKGSGNANVTNSITKYDLHLTYSLSIQKTLIEKFHARAFMLPFGYDVSPEIYMRCEKEEEICEVCFLGNPDNERASFILGLAEKEIKISVYGNQWDKFIDHPNVITNRAVYGEEQWKVLRKYRAQLNLMRIHNHDSHNMRTFEIPAIGGIMVAPDTLQHRSFFENEKEVFLFDSIDECIQKLKRVLALPYNEALKIRNAARARSVCSNYSYRHRATEVLKFFQSTSK